MIKIFLTLFLISSFLNAADSSSFSDKQRLLLVVKQMIQDEESIARAYENYILNEKKIPEDFDTLVTDEYLGSSFKSTLIPELSNFSFNFKKQLTSRFIKTSLQGDASYESIYESDSFRKKTYYNTNGTPDDKTDDFVGFKLEDEFVKHMYFLSSTGKFDLLECKDLNKEKYCWGEEDSDDENVIYIYTDDTQTDLLMYYSIDKFKTGPIIINKDAAPYDEDEFKSLPRGALLYDTSAVKYIKTLSSIEVLK
ncbi:hypothetical protein [Arcobacter peruensis]|uniref:hypothetical protein n=1 Tax=Arcobacter peruensis TaxID=2320140 RepID=UPI000F075459|nr:hypothetical protein [Arcobacter peruensis]